MNILVVSERFVHGGLMRHILTQKKAMPKDKFVYVFETYQENDELNDSSVHILKKTETVQDFIDNVEMLKNIIISEEIDYVSIHPFETLIPAIFAAHITGKGASYTIHGYTSVSIPLGHKNKGIIMSYFLNEMKDRIFCVSKVYSDELLKSYNRKNVSFLPNSLDCKPFFNNSEWEGDSKKWVLISRLDHDKKAEILKVIENIERLGIEQLDIIGVGNAFEEIIGFVKDKKIKKIRFLGNQNNISECLNDGSEKHTGVIGMGQVVLEGVASNLPVCLIGDGRITGLVNHERWNAIKECNYVNRTVPDDDLDKISRDIASLGDNIGKYRFADEACAEIDAAKVYEDYKTVISEEPVIDNNIKNIYRGICSIENGLQNSFDSSLEVYTVLFHELKQKTINQNVLYAFKWYDLKYSNENNAINIKRVSKKVNSLAKKVKSLVVRVEKIEKNKFLKQIKRIFFVRK